METISKGDGKLDLRGSTEDLTDSANLLKGKKKKNTNNNSKKNNYRNRGKKRY